MKPVIKTLAALAAAGALGGAAVVGLGLYNVSASVGHLPGVEWVLHTTFRNSVRLRAMPMDKVPDLSDPALIELGARHYATACAMCHSVPGRERSATIRAMNPVPPHIEQAVRPWQPNHLHWIILNGVKMSGMPAWPAPSRPQEVWPVIAYLMAVKEGLSAQRQAELTAPAEGAGASGIAAWCAGCHGGVDRFVPRLDIQTQAYLAHALDEYRSGARPSGIMEQAATSVTAEDLAALAEHFAAMTPEGGPAPAGDAAEVGAALAQAGTRDVPACSACHGPGATQARPEFPALAGQDAAFLEAQLRLWRDRMRGGSRLMRMAARDLTDADIAALAAYYAALAPERPADRPEQDAMPE